MEGGYDLLFQFDLVDTFMAKLWAETFLMVPTIKIMSMWSSQETILAYEVSMGRLIRSKPAFKPVLLIG